MKCSNHNNYNSKFFIINLKINKEKIDILEIPQYIIDWLDESLNTYNIELNWNIGINYEDNIITIYIYIDSKTYPYYDNETLLITNDCYSNLDYINTKIDIKKLQKCFNIHSDLLYLANTFIEKIGISGVKRNILKNEIHILKYGNRFIHKNKVFNKFIYLKNIKQNGQYKLISCENPLNNYLENLIQNTN